MSFRCLAAVAAIALVVQGCSDETLEPGGSGGTGGVGGIAGSGGSGSGGSGGVGGSGGTAGSGGAGGSGGSGGVGGSGGGTETCGNGQVDAGEECDGLVVPRSCTDLGYDAGTTGCDAACAIDSSGCEHFEDCSMLGDEDGDGDADCDDSDCATAWECPACGNGVVQAGEACDGVIPATRSCVEFQFDTGALACDPTTCELDTTGCRNFTCGDGIREAAEACDDGNNEDGDGCSADCSLEGNSCAVPLAIDDRHLDPTTGNWVIQGDTTELRPKFYATCGDAGSQRDAVVSFTPPSNGFYSIELQATFTGVLTIRPDACATAGAGEFACAISPTSAVVGLVANQPIHIVADGAAPGIQEGPFTIIVEQRSTCGDGIIQADEACDFSDAVAGDGCSPTCTIEPGWICDATGCEPPTCGNGQIGAGERCDDGNQVDGDGCDSTCQPEWTIAIEPNNAFAASGVQDALAGTGGFGSGSGDFWRLPVTDGRTYTIHTATAPDGSCGTADTDDTRLTLYLNRSQIDDQDGGGPGLCAKITFTAGAGGYQLYVRDGDSPGGVPLYYFWVQQH